MYHKGVQAWYNRDERRYTNRTKNTTKRRSKLGWLCCCVIQSQARHGVCCIVSQLVGNNMCSSTMYILRAWKHWWLLWEFSTPILLFPCEQTHTHSHACMVHDAYQRPLRKWVGWTPTNGWIRGLYIEERSSVCWSYKMANSACIHKLIVNFSPSFDWQRKDRMIECQTSLLSVGTMCFSSIVFQRFQLMYVWDK